MVLVAGQVNQSSSHRHISVNEQDRIYSLLVPVQYVCNNTVWIDFTCLKYGTSYCTCDCGNEPSVCEIRDTHGCVKIQRFWDAMLCRCVSSC